MARTVEVRRANLLCAFYTNSDAIRGYMLSRLALKDDLCVLEPAVGDGAFIDALDRTHKHLKIVCIDKDQTVLRRVKNRFGGTVNVLHADTILDPLRGEAGLFREHDLPEKYDRIVGNPPYGGWLDYNTRAALKKAYPSFYVRETYALFMLRCFDLLSTGGILSFIVPDTFLAVGVHRRLREILVRQMEVIEVLTLPSDLFPGVRFSYSGLCIITVRKPFGLPDPDHQFQVIAVTSEEEIDALARGQQAGSSVEVVQRLVAQRPDSRIWTASGCDIEKVMQNSKLRVGDIADCRTGIYTGDNKQFIRLVPFPRNCRTFYRTAATTDVCSRTPTESEKVQGIASRPAWVPLVKGGSFRFYQPTQWVLNWTQDAVEYYRTDEKARLQNQTFYFRQGIGVPMVTSSRINAFLMDGRVFDQSVVGIFPKRREWLFPLLAILNSSFATKLLKEAINPTANNSANYLKKLPLPKLSASELREIGAMARFIVQRRRKDIPTEEEERQLDERVRVFYARDQSSPTMLNTWSDLAASGGDTPLFPCLRERRHSYGSKQTGRNR